MPIKGTYADRFFSYEVAGLEGVVKIMDDDFSPLIECALSLPAADVESEQVLTTGTVHCGKAPKTASPALVKNRIEPRTAAMVFIRFVCFMGKLLPETN